MNESIMDDESINETVSETSIQESTKSDSSPESSMIEPPEPSVNVSTRRRSRRFSQLKKSTKSTTNVDVVQEVESEEVILNEPEKPPSKKSKSDTKPESEQIEAEVAAEPEVSSEMDKENLFQTPKKSKLLYFHTPVILSDESDEWKRFWTLGNITTIIQNGTRRKKSIN